MELSTTNQIQLIKLAKKLGFKLQIYSVNELPKICTEGFYIINADDEDRGGTHWIAIYNQPNHKFCIYYDSFGMDADKRVIQFMKSSNKPVIGVSIQSQDENAKSCGYWCIYFLNFMRTKSLSKYLSHIHSIDQTINENMLRKYFNNVLNLK